MEHINLMPLQEIARGDSQKMLKYLRQFQDLIPKRLENLKQSLQAHDRKEIRQILHQMSPQLQFFGIPGVVPPINRLALEYETIPAEELEIVVRKIIEELRLALAEVDLQVKKLEATT